MPVSAGAGFVLRNQNPPTMRLRLMTREFAEFDVSKKIPLPFV